MTAMTEEERARARARLAARQQRLAGAEDVDGAPRGQGTRVPSNAFDAGRAETRRARRDTGGEAARPRRFHDERVVQDDQGFDTPQEGLPQQALAIVLGVLRGLASLLGNVFGALRSNPRLLLVVVGVAIAALVVFGVSSCVSSCSVPAEEPAVQQQQPQESDEPSEYENIDEEALTELIGEDLSADLIEKAKDNKDAAWIAAHCDWYDELGEEQQTKVLKLAAKEDEAVPFVRNYLEKSPASKATAGCPDAKEGEVMPLYQWDTRWGWVGYSTAVIGTSGCGITAMAMVYQGLTGENDLSPYDFAVEATENNYVHNGTDGEFYPFAAEKHGFQYSELPVSASSITDALEDGSIIICNVGPGDFTEQGHYVVIWGVDDDGNLKINDPYSANNTATTWDVDRVVKQTKRLLCFSK